MLQNLKPILKQGPVGIGYLSATQLQDPRYCNRDRLLAVIRYGAPTLDLDLPCPVVSVPLDNLAGEDTIEVWHSDSPVESGTSGRIQYASNGEVLFGMLSFQETNSASLEKQTQEAYQEAIEFVRQQGYSHLLRVWNYLCEINQEQDHLERYRAFCKGRYEAYASFDPEFEQTLAAASAVGSYQPGVNIYFLASVEPGIALANPRQTNAYCYPEQYGPRSPSFSRAMLKAWGEHRQFYIAGTASIVGHETVHKGDIRKQLQETLENIKALHEHAASNDGVNFSETAQQQVYKVFIRHSADFPVVREVLTKELGPNADIIYLHADICRIDLLVEIEAVFVA